MPNNNRSISRASRNIQNIAKGIRNNMNDLYRTTYMTAPQQNDDLQDLNTRINSSLDKIINRNIDSVGMPSVTKLYSRLAERSKNNKMVDDLEKMFDNGLVSDDLYSLFMSNRYLKELDNEIDTVCKYMPKLEEALAVQKDCVLSADHFSKDFLNFEYPSSGKDADLFSERAKDLKRKYDLQRLVEEIYEDTSKYGEKFIYRVPYSTAIGKLLSTKPDGKLVSPIRGMNESSDIIQESSFLVNMTSSGFNIYNESSPSAAVVHESATYTNTIISRSKTTHMVESKTSQTPILRDKESFSIGLELHKGGFISSVIEEYRAALEKKSTYSSSSLTSLYESNRNPEANGSVSFSSTKRDDRIIANDGLIGQTDTRSIKVNTVGCVVRKLPREQVLPIYIDDICMGYYFFELRTNNDSESFMGFKNILGDPLTNMRGDKRCAFNSVDNDRQDEAIRYVAGQLSSFIDKQFVNNNQDLAKEIYMILKYNDLFNTPSIDTIRVTFVPPEDMVHFFFKQDSVTHRGISDLEKGLIPAKIYSSLYVTDSIGHLTRGQDKRVYYVKQTVDTNIAQTLLNTISQIKQSNFGIRQFQNINNILNITGRFNDYVIPTNASGEPPISFEVMPGQEIKTPTELMDALEEMAINSTGIPLEIIQARQSVDYAIQLTMSSSKVLRFCYKRQELFQDSLTELISPIYCYEYNETTNIKVALPPPGFINITNTNQLVDNTKGFVQSIVDVDMMNEEDENLKAVYFTQLFKHYMGTHLDIASHEKILERSKMIAATRKKEAHSDNHGNQEDDNYY